MTLHLQHDRNRLVFSGRLDATGARELDAWLAGADAVPAVWDLSGLVFLSSAGIRSLLTLDRRLRAGGRRAQVVVPAGSLVADILELAGLAAQWDIHAEAAAAHRHALPVTSGGLSRTASGRSYRIMPARGRGRVTTLAAAPEGRPLLVRFDELGVAFGRGGFSAGSAADEPEHGDLFSTGHTVLIRGAGGLTDFFETAAPAATFARVETAVRLETDAGERWDAEGAVAWSGLCADLAARAAATGAATWAAGIAGESAGRPTVLAVFAAVGQSPRSLALRADGPAGAAAGGSWAEAATAVAQAGNPELFQPDEATELTAVRAWFLADPEVVDGAAQRLVIAAPEPLPEAWERIVRATFTDEARVQLRRLTGGFMAATFAAATVDRQGRRTLPTVLKISPRAVTAREEAAHRQYVRPFILNNATVLIGQAAQGEFAGLRYNFLGITGSDSQLQPLEALYLGADFPSALAAIHQTLTNVLNPWYGQAAVSTVRPFADHDPRGLFTQLPQAAQETLGISPDAPRFACAPLGRDLPNPYYFLRNRWDGLLAHTQAWAACITHGDLNFNNVLVDERGNIYVIDFSETRIRNVAADFARLEAIALLQHPRISAPGDRDRILEVIAGSLRGPVWTMPAAAVADEPLLQRAVALATAVRGLAATRVADPAHEAAYLLPLLEWSMPIVAFRQIEPERKELAAWASGLILERILTTLGLPLPGAGP